MTTTEKRNPLSTIRPEHIDAANVLHSEAPDTVAALLAACRQAARKVTDLDRDDVAALAVLYAPSLLNQDRDNVTQAAAVATRRACHALRNDCTADDAASLDEIKDERGEPAARVASPWTPAPEAPYRTTNRDRYAAALATLDAADRWTAHALLSATWKGAKVPAAAVRQAHGLPPVTGRQGTAWTAAVAADAARLGITHTENGPRLDPASPLADEGRAQAQEEAQGTEAWQPVRYGLPRQPRRLDDAARQADAASKAAPVLPQAWTGKADDAPAPLPRRQDAKPTAGRASQPHTVSIREAHRLGIVVNGRRRSVTHDTTGALALATMRADAYAAAYAAPITLDPEPTGTERQERQDFDHEAAAEAARGRRLPGVSVDQDGAAVAPSGVSGAGAGSGKAAQRKQAPRKASRTGGTGATIPAGPRR